MEDFETIAGSLAPGDHHALILLEIRGDEEDVGRALRIAGSGGKSAWGHERLNEGFPAIVLMKMDPVRAKETVIRLIESGFARIVALYPKPAPNAGKANPPPP